MMSAPSFCARHPPTAIITSRQKLPVLDRSSAPPASAIDKGGYVLLNADDKPDLVLLAGGSEVALALEAAQQLNSEGIETNVVNIACTELFDEQPIDYRDEVLPRKAKARLAIEAGSPMPWYKYLGGNGGVMGIDRFGYVENRLLGDSLNFRRIGLEHVIFLYREYARVDWG